MTSNCRLSTGAAVRLTGTWEPSPLGKEQSNELRVHHVQVLGDNDASVRTPLNLYIL